MKNINFLLLLMESGILYHRETVGKNDAFYFTKSNKEHHFGVLNLPELAPLRRRCRFEWCDNKQVVVILGVDMAASGRFYFFGEALNILPMILRKAVKPYVWREVNSRNRFRDFLFEKIGKF